jgi:outer membrane lipoprotein LolB
MAKHSSYIFLIFTLFSSAILSGCATKPSNEFKTIVPQQSVEQRTTQLRQINQWNIRGKIAFIDQKKNKRESANIAWQVNNVYQTQELNLTSYLGINVLHLTSKNNAHLIKVNGKEYKSNNLAQLIYSLTGLTLPTDALSFWLKGLAYQSSDKIVYSSETRLPISLLSGFDNTQWQINYSHYQLFNGLQMATQFTIKKDDLLIKVALKSWTFLN